MNQKILTKTQKEIGERVRSVRERHNLSQEEMAEILGIRSRTHYQSIEYGKTQVMEKHLLILNEHFGVSPDFILLGKVENSEEKVYDFISQSPDEKIKTLIEILTYVCGGQHDVHEKILKIYRDNLTKR